MNNTLSTILQHHRIKELKESVCDTEAGRSHHSDMAATQSGDKLTSVMGVS